MWPPPRAAAISTAGLTAMTVDRALVAYGIDAVYVTTPLSAVVPPYVPAGSATEFA
jgi:hypothetical protein